MGFTSCNSSDVVRKSLHLQIVHIFPDELQTGELVRTSNVRYEVTMKRPLVVGRLVRTRPDEFELNLHELVRSRPVDGRTGWSLQFVRS